MSLSQKVVPLGVEAHFAPGELWRRVQTSSANILLTDLIGHGSFSKVHKCKFQDKIAAVKIFRNTEEEKAYSEIKMAFSLRHPNIIGFYAWFRADGALVQIGMVIELASGGDLETIYKQKKGRDLTFAIGLEIVTYV